ncbi:conserved hypothetical protein [Gammaproteobacteria bacterium]
MLNHPPIAVGILGADDRPDIVETIRSVRCVGLPIHVAVTARRSLLEGFDGVIQHVIHWNEDFSSARNQLLEQIDSDFVLWLDSDERLLSFPEIDVSRLEEDFYTVHLQADRWTTPGRSARFHRNHPLIRWHGSVHEQPLKNGQLPPYSSRMLPGAAIIHWGYEDPEILAGKNERNVAIAQCGLNRGELLFGELLSLAKSETSLGLFNFMRWLQCFRHPEIQPNAIDYDRRSEAAYMLCTCGYNRFAQDLARANPLIVRLQLGLLADGWRKHRALDATRFEFLLTVLQNGLFDQRYSFSVELVGCSHDQLTRYIHALTAEWGERREIMNTTTTTDSFDPTATYRRNDDVQEETIEEDLILMHYPTLKAVVLNPIAAVLWDALRWPQSATDLASLLHEAFPQEDATAQHTHAEEVLAQLAASGLIQPS